MFAPPAATQARLMHETLGREVRSRRAAQAALGKRDREVERLQEKVAAYKVLYCTMLYYALLYCTCREGCGAGQVTVGCSEAQEWRVLDH